MKKRVTSGTKSGSEYDESCTGPVLAMMIGGERPALVSTPEGIGAAVACGRHLARLNGEHQWRRQ